MCSEGRSRSNSPMTPSIETIIRPMFSPSITRERLEREERCVEPLGVQRPCAQRQRCLGSKYVTSNYLGEVRGLHCHRNKTQKHGQSVLHWATRGHHLRASTTGLWMLPLFGR